LSWLCRVGGSGGFEPWEASILHLAWTQAVAPQADNPESWLVRGGIAPMAQQMAEQLSLKSPGSVLLEAPVEEVSQDNDGIYVRIEGGLTIRARAVVVAVPPQQRLGIHFQPPLPAAHSGLVQRSPMGAMTKILAIYDHAFWREQGLNGLGVGNLNVLELTADSGPPEGTPGILAAFASGQRALRLGALDPSQQRKAILSDFQALWGPQASEPVQLIVKPWTGEPWIGGAFTSFPLPGSWTSYGALAAGDQGGPGPCDHGRVLWAGTEASPRWPGYCEGALEAAERAARAAQQWCLAR
jgi:monoamine oxidase